MLGTRSAVHREERCTASGTRVCGLARKRNLDAPGATKQPGGQISAYPVGQISALAPRVSPDERGGSRSSRTRGGMRWTRWRRMTNAVVADGEAVWSWHPDAGVKFAGSKTSRGCRWQESPVTGGEREISRKPLRREGRIASAEPVCSCALFCAVCTRDRGCSVHPAFPAPSSFRGWQSTQSSGASRRENADAHPLAV